MSAKDVIEFYHGEDLIAAVNSSIALQEGRPINIRKKAWRITRVSYAIDRADDQALCRMRCNVDLEPN